jgi:hypothetical protein
MEGSNLVGRRHLSETVVLAFRGGSPEHLRLCSGLYGDLGSCRAVLKQDEYP